MNKRDTELDLPELHRINGAITGAPLYSYDKETYHTTPEAALSAYRSHQRFWKEIVGGEQPKKGKK